MPEGSNMQGNIVIGSLSCLKDFAVGLKQVRSLCNSLSDVFVVGLFLTHALQFKKKRHMLEVGKCLFECLSCYFILIFSSILQYCKDNVNL